MEDREKEIIDFYLAGASQIETGRKFHMNYKNILKILKKNGIHIRTNKEAQAKAIECGSRVFKKKKLTWTEEEEKTVLYWYVNEGRGQVFSGKQAGIKNVKIVRAILEKNGVHVRNYSEAATISNQNRALYKNEDYFSIQSPNMAWLMGFIAADGYIHKKDNGIDIGLSSVDREILERIKVEVEIENEIRDFLDRDGFANSELCWTCQKHKKELAKYNIVPQKTTILKPPYLLDKKYHIDYVRGYFDGDGSVNFIESNGKKHYTALRWQVCSATREVLEFILDVLERYGVNKVNIQTQNKNRNAPIYCIQYSTNATKQIYNILYSTESDLYLARKKNHFEEILQKI